jgi:hypothetical protein
MREIGFARVSCRYVGLAYITTRLWTAPGQFPVSLHNQAVEDLGGAFTSSIRLPVGFIDPPSASCRLLRPPEQIRRNPSRV